MGEDSCDRACTADQSNSDIANHTEMVTGVNASVHQVLFNCQVIPPGAGKAPHVDSQRTKDDTVHAPIIYDLAFEAGLTAAQVDWIATNEANIVTGQFLEQGTVAD